MEHTIKLNLETPFSLYDFKGKEIHYKDSNGHEEWKEYDENGNIIHLKNSNGIEYWYDKHGNVIPDPNKVTEVTLEEISEEFNIPLKNIRIKD